MAKDIEKVRAARRRWYARNKDHAKSKIRKRLKELKAWWQDYKSTLKCSKCPENHTACIEFHHHNDDKEMNVCEAVKNGLSKERILEEAAKCEILCANCHRKAHWSLENGRLRFKK